MAESTSQSQNQRTFDEEKERSRSNETDDDDALRLRRETEVPHYTPQQGTGASVLDGPGTQGSVISTTNTPLTDPGPGAGGARVPQLNATAASTSSNKQNGAGYFPPYASPNGLDRDANTSSQHGQTYMSHDSPGPDVPISTAGLSTPSSGFGYSPGTFSPYGPAGSAATANGASPGTLS